jgi:hypothetical protein
MFRRNKTLDSILSDFAKVRADLEEYIKEHEIKVKENDELVRKLINETSEIEQNLAHAGYLLDKIRGLIGG